MTVSSRRCESVTGSCECSNSNKVSFSHKLRQSISQCKFFSSQWQKGSGAADDNKAREQHSTFTRSGDAKDDSNTLLYWRNRMKSDNSQSWASQQIMSYRHRISDGTRIRSPVWGTKHKTAQKIKIYVRFICQILAGTVCTWDFKKYSVHTYIQQYQMSFHDFHRIFFWTSSHIQSSRLPSGLAYN